MKSKPTSVPIPSHPLTLECFIASFDFRFVDSEIGWMNISGDWTLENGYYIAYGLRGVWTRASHASGYKDFAYQERLKRNSCLFCAYGLIVRGQPEPLGEACRWRSGYGFYITRNGYFGVFKYTAGNASPLQDWVITNNIEQGADAWNALLNEAKGDHLAFYINRKAMILPIYLAMQGS